jgi:hypothetical protein
VAHDERKPLFTGKVDTYVIIDPAQNAKIKVQFGHLILYYDVDKDEVVVQSSAGAELYVKPRAGNSVALALRKE